MIAVIGTGKAGWRGSIQSSPKNCEDGRMVNRHGRLAWSIALKSGYRFSAPSDATTKN